MSLDQDHNYKSFVPFVKKVLPSFISQDESLLVSFMEAYFEWMEQEGKAQWLFYEFENLSDIERSADQFFEYFRQEYLDGIPSDIQTNKHLTLKNIRDLYSSKGTEKSIRLLFKILYGEDGTLIDRPGERILKPSNGIWDRRFIVRVDGDALSDKLDDLEGELIIGNSSKIKAVIEIGRIVKQTGGSLKTEFEYSGAENLFQTGETVEFLDRTETFTVESSEQLEGYFRSTKGFLDNINVLQDGRRNQDFSYVIRSDKSYPEYKEVIKKTVHPAGVYFGGEIVVSDYLDISDQSIDLVYPPGEFPSTYTNVILAANT